MSTTDELRIAPNFALPLSTLTRRIVVLGQSETGKTNTVTDIAEEVLARDLQVVIVDYKGDFWGLQSSADGKRDGYPIVIFGGDHGDIEMHEDAGVVVVDSIVENGYSAIIDLSNFESKASIRRFVTAFAKRLFFKKRHRPTPMLLILDEVDQFAPQRPFEGEQFMLGAIETLVRLGRKRGIGVAMTTQAPAIVSKNVLEQGDLYVLHQMSGKNSVKAIEDAVRRNATPEELQTLSRGIGRLQKGEAFVYSPSWLRVLEQVTMRKRRTFDSSRTPEVGDVVLVPTRKATPDIPALRATIEEARERAKADDPKALRATIAALQKQLATKDVADPAEVAQLRRDLAEAKLAIVELESRPPQTVEVPALTDKDRELLHRAVGEVQDALATAKAEFLGAAGRIETNLAPIVAALGRATAAPVPARPDPVARPQRPAPTSVAPRREAAPRAQDVPADGTLGKAHRQLLTALAQNRDGLTRDQLSLLSGYSVNSSHFANVLGALRSAGYVKRGDPIEATAEGRAALGHYEPLPEGAGLRAYWLNRLGRADRALLQVLIDAHPGSVTKDDLSERSGYSVTSSHFANMLGKLRTLKLAVGYGEIKASDALF